METALYSQIFYAIFQFCTSYIRIFWWKHSYWHFFVQDIYIPVLHLFFCASSSLVVAVMLIFSLLKLPSYTFSRSIKTDSYSQASNRVRDAAILHCKKKHSTVGGCGGGKFLNLRKYRVILHGCSRAICMCWLEFYKTKPHAYAWMSDVYRGNML